MPTYDNMEEIATRFLFNHVITRFGVPKELVSDHGNHFGNEIFQELSHHLGFTHEFVSPYYPKSNGKVQVVNKVLKIMLQHMVNNHKNNWHHMVFSALCAYLISVKSSTRFTPFQLVYGVEAMIPINHKIPNLHIAIELLDDIHVRSLYC